MRVGVECVSRRRVPLLFPWLLLDVETQGSPGRTFLFSVGPDRVSLEEKVCLLLTLNGLGEDTHAKKHEHSPRRRLRVSIVEGIH